MFDEFLGSFGDLAARDHAAMKAPVERFQRTRRDECAHELAAVTVCDDMADERICALYGGLDVAGRQVLPPAVMMRCFCGP